MLKKLKIFLFILIIPLTIPLCGCEISFTDYIDPQDFITDLDIRDFLNTKNCYEQLYEDLIYMNSTCYLDQKLASSQAFTIMISYGLADMSKDASTYSDGLRNIKASLFETIKRINLYTSVTTAYDAYTVRNETNVAIGFCQTMLNDL